MLHPVILAEPSRPADGGKDRVRRESRGISRPSRQLVNDTIQVCHQISEHIQPLATLLLVA